MEPDLSGEPDGALPAAVPVSAVPSNDGGSSGATLILGATVVAGVAGYLVTWLVNLMIGPAAYALFAIFWGAIYLVIGALSGVQQEITRATHPIEPGSREKASRARNFAVTGALLVAVVVIASAPLWVDRVFPDAGWALVLPLAVGAASYVLVATLCGSLYGVTQWRSLALLIGFDALLRLALLGVALLFTHDIVVLAWMVALPFPLTIALLWPVVRGGFVGRSDIDVGYRALTWNVARTVLASTATAMLVSGLPLLLGVAAVGVDQSLLGELLFTITLSRAPLIVTVMSLQSYFLLQFRNNPATWARTFLRIQAAIALGTIVIGALGWWLGPAAFALVTGRPSTIDGSFIAVLVVSSALVGSLCLSAPAVLAKGQHFIYSLGWVVAAIVTIAALALPIGFIDSVIVALLAGPVAGLLVHLGWLLAVRGRVGASTMAAP
ncbi:hypothetical protein FB562_1741 [Homoserinimonas aerilata]|uniref:O-antigen/teichoic acid export membrane protein n=1 Tax=Homoserinimonas aerilata TaxID=1162970 RepID=A0A542YKM5_9MICO|nr:hypothetical protein [Homoserinimonas aerilata]TQL48643.1 hypothetical protein FB562_1741 [Homoserinimonas aerilata]